MLITFHNITDQNKCNLGEAEENKKFPKYQNLLTPTSDVV